MIAEYDVSREAKERIDAYVDLITRWNERINLVARGDDLRSRHVEDALQLLPLLPARPVRHVDLGSGGGLPALPIWIARAEVGVEDDRILIESDGRKAAFLRTALREAGLKGRVLAERIEAAPPQGAAVVTARALAPLPALLPLAARHLAPGGTAILPKGAGAEAEIAAARAAGWGFDLARHPSRTDPAATILLVSAVTAP